MHTIEWTRTGGKTHRVVFRDELTVEQREELRRQSWINRQLQNALGNYNPYAQSNIFALGSLLGAQNAYGSAAWHAQQQAAAAMNAQAQMLNVAAWRGATREKPKPDFDGVTLDGVLIDVAVSAIEHKAN